MLLCMKGLSCEGVASLKYLGYPVVLLRVMERSYILLQGTRKGQVEREKRSYPLQFGALIFCSL